MTASSRSIAACSVRWLLLASAVLAWLRARRAAQCRPAYDGIWSVMIITQAGSCDRGLQLSVQGRRAAASRPAAAAECAGSVRGGGGVVVRISAGGSVANGTGRLGGRLRRRPLERQNLPAAIAAAAGRPGGARSTCAMQKRKTARQIDPDGPNPSVDDTQTKRPRAQRGASTITTWRPSNRASCSTLAISATSLFTLSSSLVPISWCAISRPR